MKNRKWMLCCRNRTLRPELSTPKCLLWVQLLTSNSTQPTTWWNTIFTTCSLPVNMGTTSAENGRKKQFESMFPLNKSIQLPLDKFISMTNDHGVLMNEGHTSTKPAIGKWWVKDESNLTDIFRRHPSLCGNIKVINLHVTPWMGEGKRDFIF